MEDSLLSIANRLFSIVSSAITVFFLEKKLVRLREVAFFFYVIFHFLILYLSFSVRSTRNFLYSLGFSASGRLLPRGDLKRS